MKIRIDLNNRTTDAQIAKTYAKAFPKFRSLEEVATQLLGDFPDWFVYRGAHHVALHRSQDAEAPRLLLIVEATA